MLGDGHLQLDLSNRSKNARLIVRRSIKDKSYLLHQHTIFSDFCSNNSIKEYNSIDIRMGKSYAGISMTTRSNEVFTAYHSLWYPNIKRVPKDLSLDNVIVLNWFLDDGCIVRTKSGKLEIKFSTNGFNKEDNLLLQRFLSERYCCKFDIYQSNNLFHIRGNDAAANSIIKDVESIYPFDLMGRKAIWKNDYQQETHSYDIRSKKIEDFLYNKDHFYTNELGRYAGFIFTRSNGRVEVSASNLKKYLNKYIENKYIELSANDIYHNGIKYQITSIGKTYFKGKNEV